MELDHAVEPIAVAAEEVRGALPCWRSAKASLSTRLPSVYLFGWHVETSPYHLTCRTGGRGGPVDSGMSRRGNLSELSTAIPPGSPASASSERRGSPTRPSEAPIRAAEVDRAVPGSTRRHAHPSHDGLCHPPADRAPTIPSPLVALKGLDVPRIERTDGIRPRRREGFIATCCNGNLVAAEFANSPTTDHAPNAGEHNVDGGSHAMHRRATNRRSSRSAAESSVADQDRAPRSDDTEASTEVASGRLMPGSACMLPHLVRCGTTVTLGP